MKSKFVLVAIATMLVLLIGAETVSTENGFVKLPVVSIIILCKSYLIAFLKVAPFF